MKNEKKEYFKMTKLLKNFSFAIISNFMTLIVSTIVILIIPKIISVQEYGIWQIFIFYNSYVGLLHFGWIDGIYLRYGGIEYVNLNKSNMKVQLIMFFSLQLMISFGVFIFGQYYFVGFMRAIVKLLACTIIIVNVKDFFQFILQTTNRIVSYSISNIIGTSVYVTLLIYMIVCGNQTYVAFIWCYIISQIISLIYSSYSCRAILRSQIKIYHLNFHEAFKNIYTGLHLVFSNVAAMLIVGIVKFGIQIGWNIEEFAKLSLILSISNFVMIFIYSISLVLFPVLRNINDQKFENVYNSMKFIIVPFLLILLTFMYPLKYVITFWLPQYSSASYLLSVLFPMLVYQAKFEILSNTMMKVMRLEKQLLSLNVISLTFGSVLTLVFVHFLHNLGLTILTLVIVMFGRNILSELVVQKKFNSFSWTPFIKESLIVFLFIFLNSNFNSIISIGVYISALLIYFYTIKDQLVASVHQLRNTIS